MRNKKEELDNILNRYSKDVQILYNNILNLEKEVKNVRKAQLKSFIKQEILKQVE